MTLLDILLLLGYVVLVLAVIAPPNAVLRKVNHVKLLTSRREDNLMDEIGDKYDDELE